MVLLSSSEFTYNRKAAEMETSAVDLEQRKGTALTRMFPILDALCIQQTRYTESQSLSTFSIFCGS